MFNDFSQECSSLVYFVLALNYMSFCTTWRVKTWQFYGSPDDFSFPRHTTSQRVLLSIHSLKLIISQGQKTRQSCFTSIYFRNYFHVMLPVCMFTFQGVFHTFLSLDQAKTFVKRQTERYFLTFLLRVRAIHEKLSIVSPEKLEKHPQYISSIFLTSWHIRKAVKEVSSFLEKQT